MTVWLAGLFFLPRLLVARHRKEADGAADHANPIINTLYFRIMTPAGLVTIAAGMVLIAYGPWGAWLVLKLCVVMLAVFIHLYLGLLIYEMGRGRDRHGVWFYRALGWTPLLLVLVMATLTGAKPDSVGDLPPPPTAPMSER